ncbi:MAG: pentapeptide repeat-containing protein [Streptosporangiaceae bacterium]
MRQIAAALVLIGSTTAGCSSLALSTTESPTTMCERHSGPALAGQDLTKVAKVPRDLKCANLTGARLEALKLGTIYDLTGADLQKAKLHGTRLDQVDLNGADLRGADLSGAYLVQSDLNGADLRGANLHGADLSQAELKGARLDDADLRSAGFDQADLTGASLNGAQAWGAHGIQLTVDGTSAGGIKGLWPFYVLPGLVLIGLLASGALRVGRNARSVLLLALGSVVLAAATLLITCGLVSLTLGWFTPIMTWQAGPLAIGGFVGAFLTIPLSILMLRVGTVANRAARRPV